MISRLTRFSAQLPAAVQEDQPEGAEVVVQADPEGAGVSAFEIAADHPQGPEVRQYFYHRHDGLRENRRFGTGNAQKQEFRQVGECFFDSFDGF